MRFLPFLIIIISSMLFGCSTFFRGGNTLVLEQFKSLKLGTSKEEVLTLIGQPNKKFVLTASNEELWFYTAGPTNQPRMSLTFDLNNNTLQVANWHVKEVDYESQLDKSVGLFKNANFEKTNPKWENPHAGPDFISYVDLNLGIEIEYSKHRKLVRNIVRRIPDSSNLPSNEARIPAKYEL